jgi:hypothetical protein
METLFFYVFFGAVTLFGAVAFIFPAKVVAFRQRRRFSKGLWSGGWFYETADRTRVMGLLLGVIGFMAVLSRALAP